MHFLGKKIAVPRKTGMMARQYNKHQLNRDRQWI